MTTSVPDSDAIETEWQFDAPDLDRVKVWLQGQPAHSGLTFSPAKDRTQNDRYLDTDDWAVYRAGFSLRLRTVDLQTEATLKALGASAGGPVSRREISQGLESPEEDVFAQAGPVSERLRLLAGGRALRELFEVQTHRRTYDLNSEGSLLAELALDETRIEKAGVVSAELRRVEIEVLSGAEKPLLEACVAALQAATGLQPSQLSKFAAGLAAAGLDPVASWRSAPTATAPDLDAAEFGLATVRRFYFQMLRHEPGTRLGEDPEELHDMRVATRRLRAVLSMFEPVLPAQFVEIREGLRSLARSLGEVRDLDVQVEALAEMRSGAVWEERLALGELMQILAASRQEARSRLMEALDGEAYSILRTKTDAALALPPTTDPAAPIREFAARVLRKRFRRFRRHGSTLTPESESADYHEQRVLAKRLRYSVEFTVPMLGDRAQQLAAAVVTVQDILGAHQDAAVTIDWLRQLVLERGPSLAPGTVLFMGETIARRQMLMQELKEQWPEAFADVRYRWRRLRRELKGREPKDGPAEAPPDESDPALPAPHASAEGTDAGGSDSRRRWVARGFGLIRSLRNQRE